MSQPITIRSPSHHRQRSGSISSSDSDSPPTLSTPTDAPAQSPSTVSASPILSYFLNTPSIPPSQPNGMAKSPTFPSLGRVPFGSTAVMENDSPPSSPTAAYPGSISRNRRLNSISWQPNAAFGGGGPLSTHPNGTAAPPTSPTSAGADDRAGGILRRFSLSSAFARPSAVRPSSPPSQPPVFEGPPASATSANFPLSPPSPQQRKGRRATMLAVPPGDGRGPSPTRTRRAPSPMGERILKGHFDGFN